MLWAADAGGETRYRLQDIDRRVMTFLAQMTRQHDVPVQNPPHGIRYGLIHVVALHQNREKPGDRSAVEVARALEDLGQHLEHRWSVALLAGRFARRQADFALRHG